MTDSFVATHKAKHLLAHVLVVAGARHWPDAALGKSGETATGFYADFALSEQPTDEQLEALTDGMARVLRDFQSFREVRLTPEEALKARGNQAWKRYQIGAIAEYEPEIRCYELDGFVDVCDCALKDPNELRALHPEKFFISGAHPVVWTHRGRDEFFIRVHGEIFPAVARCDCCEP